VPENAYGRMALIFLWGKKSAAKTLPQRIQGQGQERRLPKTLTLPKIKKKKRNLKKNYGRRPSWGRRRSSK